MADQIGWATILATALISSLFTAAIAEPIKAFIQRHLRRKELRRALYNEIVNNFGALHSQVEMAKHDIQMKDGIGRRFAMSYKRLAYELAQKDSAAYYSLGFDELYWIENHYRDFEHVINGRFDDNDQHLRNAEFAAEYVLNNLKNRHLSKRLMFKVAPPWLKEYFRENLPKTSYIYTNATLTVVEKLRRRYDQLQYYVWQLGNKHRN